MPGRHNSSSVEGGIFGEPIAQSAPPARSVISAPYAQVAAAPTVVAAPRFNNNVSSIEGGIFGSAEAVASERREGVTKSSVEGGIFGGNNPYANMEPTANPTKGAVAPMDYSRVAGQPIAPQENFSLFAGAPAPLAPLPSARRNNNASSIDGGIFGPPTTAHKPSIPRGNPNQSSVQGGIFG